MALALIASPPFASGEIKCANPRFSLFCAEFLPCPSPRQLWPIFAKAPRRVFNHIEMERTRSVSEGMIVEIIDLPRTKQAGNHHYQTSLIMSSIAIRANQIRTSSAIVALLAWYSAAN